MSLHAARIRWGLLGVAVVAAIVSWLWHAPPGVERETTPRPPHRADAYEGSSGMGADGFGGYPSRPARP